MKKMFKKNFYLILAVPFIFIGCSKLESTDDANSISDSGKDLKTTGTFSCATTVYGDFFAALTNLSVSPTTITAGSNDYGDLEVTNDQLNLYLTIKLAEGWKITEAHVFAGNVADLPDHPNSTEEHAFVRPDGTGHFFPNSAPFIHYYPGVAEEGTHKFTIPWGNMDNCVTIVAALTIHNLNGVKKTVTAKLRPAIGLKCYGFWFEYCRQDCYIPGCETAWALGLNPTCFIGMPNIASNNWGWTNKIELPVSNPTTYDWPLWGGAGQCNTDKGKIVGNLHVVIAGTKATITYKMWGGYIFTGNHLYVGSIPLPLNKKQEYINNPGQFELKDKFSYSVTIPQSGDLYIAAHTEACLY